MSYHNNNNRLVQNTSSTMPIQENRSTYFLQSKQVTIHSEDREITKYPNQNEFEITLPQALKNVQSITLVNWAFPKYLPTFTRRYQNTKLLFLVQPPVENWDSDTNFYPILNAHRGEAFELEIPEGVYTEIQMANMLQLLLNSVVTSYLDNHLDPSVWYRTYDRFRVKFDTITKKFVFANTMDGFTILAGKQIDYSSCSEEMMWTKHSQWGLPYFIGFDKADYLSGNNTSTLLVSTDDSTSDMEVVLSGPGGYVLIAENMANLNPNNVFYMEIDKYNSIDEIVPLKNPNSSYSNHGNGNVNGAFAKIFKDHFIHYGQNGGATCDYGMHISSKPYERIAKLKFRFRYHNGNLVDFGGQDFNFNIGFGCFVPEIESSYSCRIPETYVGCR